jgi:hypothetical protein
MAPPARSALYDQFDALGVTYVHRHRQQGTAKVSFTMRGPGGTVDDTGGSVPGWVSDFLADAAQVDVVPKLARSGAARTEVFIAVTLDGAPWSVVSYLTGEVTVVPTDAPTLRPPVMGVWVCPETPIGDPRPFGSPPFHLAEGTVPLAVRRS